MKIELGTTLTVKGQDWICHEISKLVSNIIARNDAEWYRSQAISTWPYVHYMKTEIEDFVVGDIITLESESLQLWLVDRAQARVQYEDCLRIYLTYTIRKEADGQQGLESGAGEAAGAETESSGSGDPSAQSTGTPAPSQDGDPVHGGGSTGEAGAALCTRAGEEREHAVT